MITKPVLGYVGAVYANGIYMYIFEGHPPKNKANNSNQNKGQLVFIGIYICTDVAYSAGMNPTSRPPQGPPESRPDS